VTVADMDGDGYPDLVLTDQNGSPNQPDSSWYRFDGANWEWEERDICLQTVGAYFTLPIDVNNDGLMDAVICSDESPLRLNV
jgi:hypothetical protein